MISKLLGAFKLAKLLIVLRPRSYMVLPGYKGAAFRGGFGYAFKSIACPAHDRDCIHRRLNRTCIYSQVFETPVPPGSSVMRKYPYAPHPFVLVPPLDRRMRFTAEDELRVELILFGYAIPWLAYFILAMEELGRRGVGPQRSPYRVERVENYPSANSHPAEPGTAVYDPIRRDVVGTPKVIDGAQFMENAGEQSVVTVSMVTPVRIVSRGSLATELPFTTLIRTLLRRLALLAYFHCGQPVDAAWIREMITAAEVVRVKKSALRWRDWERFSTRQQAYMNLGGLAGEITYEGNLGPFLPFLRLGEFAHVGKGTSFGLGKFMLSHG